MMTMAMTVMTALTRMNLKQTLATRNAFHDHSLVHDSWNAQLVALFHGGRDWRLWLYE